MNKLWVELYEIKKEYVKTKINTLKEELDTVINRQNEILEKEEELQELFTRISSEKILDLQFDIVEFIQGLENEGFMLANKEENMKKEIEISSGIYDTYMNKLEELNIHNNVPDIQNNEDIKKDINNDIEEVVNTPKITGLEDIISNSNSDNINNNSKPIILVDEVDLIKLEWQKEREIKEQLEKEKRERELAAQKRREELLKQPEQEEELEIKQEQKPSKKKFFWFK